jgi:hypothetical protein
MGDENMAMINNAFDIHDRATTASRIGRVRQSISTTPPFPDSSPTPRLVSEVDLEVGVLPGLPFRVKGTVVTTAALTVVSDDTWETKIIGTSVKRSNIPVFNQLLDDANIELPMNTLFEQVSGSVPVVPMKTFYVDEGMRITRDVDDNFFVFTRS